MAITHVIARSALTLVLAALVSSMAAAEELSLSQVINITIQNNPTISAGLLAAQASHSSAKGARALANPQFEVAPTIIGEAGADAAILISQPLEINGSRKARGRIAEEQARAASYKAQAIAQKLVLEVKETYWDVALAQALVQQNQDNIEYLNQLHEFTKKQLDVGAVPGSQFVKSEVELARARQQMALAELELAQSKSALNTLMNRPTGQDFKATDSLTYRDYAVSLTPMLQSAQETRPDIAAAQSELVAARGRTKAAKLVRVPDLSIQARRGSFDDSDDQGVAIGVNLPIFDWGSSKAEQKSAAAAAQAQEKLLEAARIGAALDVRQAVDEVSTLAQIVRNYDSGIIEKSEQLARMAQIGFEKGATSYLEVLEAQRTVSAARTDYFTALADHSKALARLEWASGTDIAKFVMEEKK